MSRGPIVAFVALILILLAQGLSLAETEEDRVTLGPGDAWEITIDNDAGEDLWIEYEVRVVEGPPINVWFVPVGGLMEYHNASATSFTFYSLHSVEETTYANESWFWSEEGVYFVIIDNHFNMAEDQEVTVEFSVSWETIGFDLMIMFSIVIAIVIIIIVLVIVIALMVAKREAAARKAEMDDPLAIEVRPPDAIEKRPSVVPKKPPEPPKAYPEWVVKASMEETGHSDDDAEGWDPGRDEPRDW